MVNGWKIRLSLHNSDCDFMYDQGIVVEDMPIPRKGEIIWLSSNLEHKLEHLIETCEEKKSCFETCPFYNPDKKITCIPDYIFVSDVIYKMKRKEVVIHISDNE